MMSSPEPVIPTPRRASWWPFYYGWVIVCVAALAMSATLPGRTHGLGLITEPLIADLKIDRPLFAQINLLTSLLGAAFCLPVGFLLDRWGTRSVLTLVVLALGASVVGMSWVHGPITLCIALLLVRGFGQSALSVVSITAVGKWFRRRLGIAMGVYSVLLTFGFIGPILAMGGAVKEQGWRVAWSELGWVLLIVVAPLGWLLQRNRPEDLGQTLDAAPPAVDSAVKEISFTLQQALRTPAFWVFACGTATYNLVWSGVTLFNESVLEQRGFGSGAAVTVMAVLTATGLPANIIAGALVRRERLGMLLGCGMALLTVSLALLPVMTTTTHLYFYASAMGLAGGLVMVIFFAVWGQLFGRAELGRIQGVAQLISVLASSLGPVFLAECQRWLGGYNPIFYVLAVFTALLGLVAFWLPLPKLEEGTLTESTSTVSPLVLQTVPEN